MYTNHKISVDLVETFNSPIGDTILIGDLVTIIASNAVFIAGMIVTVLIIFAGIKIIQSGGNVSPENMAKGRMAATAAIVGLIIVFSAYWIVQFIEFLTGIDIFNPSGI